MTIDDRVEFGRWLSEAGKALTEAPQSQAVTDGQVALNNLRSMFTGEAYSHEPEAAKQDLSAMVDRLVDTATVRILNGSRPAISSAVRCLFARRKYVRVASLALNRD